MEQREIQNIHKNQSLVFGCWFNKAIFEYDDDQFDKEFIAEKDAVEKMKEASDKWLI